MHNEDCRIKHEIICQWLEGQWVNLWTSELLYLRVATAVTRERPCFVSPILPWVPYRNEAAIHQPWGDAVRERRVYQENLECSSLVWKAFAKHFSKCKFFLPAPPFWEGKYCIFTTNLLQDDFISAEIFCTEVISNSKACRNNNVWVWFVAFTPFIPDPILSNSRPTWHKTTLNNQQQNLLLEKPMQVNLWPDKELEHFIHKQTTKTISGSQKRLKVHPQPIQAHIFFFYSSRVK